MIVRNLYLLIEDLKSYFPKDAPVQEKLNLLYRSTDVDAIQSLIEDNCNKASSMKWLEAVIERMEKRGSKWKIKYFQLLSTHNALHMRLKNMEIKQLKTKEKK